MWTDEGSRLRRAVTRVRTHVRTVPRPVVAGLGCVLVGFVAIAAFAAITLGPTGTADARSHLDYIVQVDRGDLPEPYGYEFSYDDDRPTGHLRQFASAHPPGYYAVMSVPFGDALQGEHWIGAVQLLRATNVVIGCVGLVLLSWLGWTVGGPWRERLAVGVPAIAAGTFSYLRFSAEVYPDLLATVVATAAILLAARALLLGPTIGLAVGSIALGAAGMGIRATYVVTLAACIAALALSWVLHRRSHRVRAAITGGGIAAGVGVASIVPFAWFYAINVDRSGYWYRSTPKLPLPGRPRIATSTWLSAENCSGGAEESCRCLCVNLSNT